MSALATFGGAAQAAAHRVLALRASVLAARATWSFDAKFRVGGASRQPVGGHVMADAGVATSRWVPAGIAVPAGPLLAGWVAWLAVGLRRFDLAAEFGVLAVVEYQSGQAKRLVRGELAGQRNDDVRGGLDADDGGRAGPADDLRDQALLRCDGCGSVLPSGHARGRKDHPPGGRRVNFGAPGLRDRARTPARLRRAWTAPMQRRAAGRQD